MNNNRLELSFYEMQLAFTRQPASPALAYNTAFSQLDGGEINIPGDTGLLLLSEVGTDVLGQTYQFNLPIVGSIHAGVLKQAYLTAKAHDIPVVLCAEYPDDDSITYDLLFLQS